MLVVSHCLVMNGDEMGWTFMGGFGFWFLRVMVNLCFGNSSLFVIFIVCRVWFGRQLV